MTPRHVLLIATALATLLAASYTATARTWRVERDGSGDYTTIQPAVDGAAPGDTIWIGAGRYTEFAPFTTPGRWTEDVYVVISVDNLTLVGDGPEETIIGPTEPNFIGFGPKGIVALSDITYIKLRDFTIENIRDGIYRSWGGYFEAQNCYFRECWSGIISWADGGTVVEECLFQNNVSSGMKTFDPANNIEVRNCVFEDNEEGIGFNWTVNTTVEQCLFDGGIVGISFSNYSSGSVYDCIFTDVENFAIAVTIASSAQIERNRVYGGAGNLAVITVSHVIGSENILGGGSFATIYNSHSTMDFHGNHIFNDGGHSVLLTTFLDLPDVNIDLTNNYWGTDNPDSIAAWIYDGNDDPSIHAFIDYEPFSGEPMPTERKSWGGVKALYR